MANKLPPLVPPSNPYVQEDRKPTQPFFQFMFAFAQLFVALTAGNNTTLNLSAPLINAANDAAAAAAGVELFGFYRNVNAIQQRLV